MRPESCGRDRIPKLPIGTSNFRLHTCTYQLQKQRPSFLPTLCNSETLCLRAALWISHVYRMTHLPGPTDDHKGKALRTRVGVRGKYTSDRVLHEYMSLISKRLQPLPHLPDLYFPLPTLSLITAYEHCCSDSTS